MSRQYSVFEVSPAGSVSDKEIRLAAATPEEAARIALGESLSRGGHRTQLRAKVYTTDTSSGALTMVRLYAMNKNQHRHLSSLEPKPTAAD